MNLARLEPQFVAAEIRKWETPIKSSGVQF
jgi:hypothetical protein